ncbi:hypothetical protein SAMN06298221_10240 [Sphaerochaeta associata]|nr:hypothetical protein SAMN06298221_10240 [Sphaerochaeta associata]
MIMLATIVSIALILFLVWQILSSIWNIVAIVLELVRDK